MTSRTVTPLERAALDFLDENDFLMFKVHQLADYYAIALLSESDVESGPDVARGMRDALREALVAAVEQDIAAWQGWRLPVGWKGKAA